jgi:hypothetical protein
MQIHKYCALALALTLSGAPLSAYAANAAGTSGANGSNAAASGGTAGGGSPDCPNKGDPMMAGQKCEESKTAAPSSSGN